MPQNTISNIARAIDNISFAEVDGKHKVIWRAYGETFSISEPTDVVLLNDYTSRLWLAKYYGALMAPFEQTEENQNG